ncbi:hypothetical protein BGZ97_009710 [Linnemannia gamsii]|uniref:Uncharacterized protein n=1 Tax=Linnemannia gamsii TaxID=64522 RepID=A0A9P6R889_9FUNG|nr:hypothetical protein BGZ97_009710 [Linnemannia gamsii]
MELPTNLHGPPNNSTFDQNCGEAQFNKPDTIGILKQQLVNIAKKKHEKLVKDVQGVLQSFSSGMESDLIYIINEYTGAKSELDELTRENLHLKAVNATLNEQLLNSQRARVDPGSSVQDRTAIENLQLELEITKTELSRALGDVEALQTQQTQMEVAIEHKDVVNQQLAAILNNRQTDLNVKQKENTEIARLLVETRTKLTQTMNFVGQYYPVLEAEVMKRQALQQQQLPSKQQQLTSQQQQQQLTSQQQQQQLPSQQQQQQLPSQQQQQQLPSQQQQQQLTSQQQQQQLPSQQQQQQLPSQQQKQQQQRQQHQQELSHPVAGPTFNGPVMGSFSQGPSSSSALLSSRPAFPIHQGNFLQHSSAPLAPSSSASPSSTHQVQPVVVSQSVTASPALHSSTGSNSVSTAGLLQQVKSQTEVNAVQRQDQDRKFQDMKQQVAIDWREKQEQQALRQLQSGVIALGAVQQSNKQLAAHATQQHQHHHQQEKKLQPQQPQQHLQQHFQQQKFQQLQFQHMQYLQQQRLQQQQLQQQQLQQQQLQQQQLQQQQLQRQKQQQQQQQPPPMMGQFQKQQLPRFIDPSVDQVPASPRTSNADPVLGNTVTPAPVSHPTSSSITTAPTSVTPTINPALLLSPTLTPGSASLLTTPISAEETGPTALDSEPASTTTEPTAPIAGSATVSSTPITAPEKLTIPPELLLSSMISRSQSEEPPRPTQNSSTSTRKRSYESSILLEDTDTDDEDTNTDTDTGYDDDERFSQPTPVDFDFDHDWAPPPSASPSHKQEQAPLVGFKREPGKWYLSSVLIPAFTSLQQQRRVLTEIGNDENEDVDTESSEEDDGDDDDDDVIFLNVESLADTRHGVRSLSSSSPVPSRPKPTAEEIYIA